MLGNTGSWPRSCQKCIETRLPCKIFSRWWPLMHWRCSARGWLDSTGKLTMPVAWTLLGIGPGKSRPAPWRVLSTMWKNALGLPRHAQRAFVIYAVPVNVICHSKTSGSMFNARGKPQCFWTILLKPCQPWAVCRICQTRHLGSLPSTCGTPTI